MRDCSPSVVLDVAPAVTMDEASSMLVYMILYGSTFENRHTRMHIHICISRAPAPLALAVTGTVTDARGVDANSVGRKQRTALCTDNRFTTVIPVRRKVGS